MKRDFTLSAYKDMLTALKESSYYMCGVLEFLNINNNQKKIAILKHDVDKNPRNALKLAIIENLMEINATYYFRILSCSFNTEIIKKISDMGHEIGYHYEDLSLARGDYVKAIEMFNFNLKKLREITAIRTISMHGSPLSRWDNNQLWKKYDYKKYGVIGNPPFSAEFEEMAYFTETGRRWNNSNFSIRDYKKSALGAKVKNTYELINLIREHELYNRIMINTHPQRWSDSTIPWMKELLFQNMKNMGKYFLKSVRNIE